MNFTEEEKQALGEQVLDTVSQPLIEMDRSHIKLDLPFTVEHILTFDNLDELQKLKLRMVEDIVAVFLKYPTLYSIGFGYMEGRYNISPSSIGWDYPEIIFKTADYQKSRLIVHAFTGNFLNGKRDIKFIRNKDNVFVSYNEIKKELGEIFSYVNEGKNSNLLMSYSKTEKNTWYLDFSTIKWSGEKNKKFSSDIHEFLGNEFVKSLMYSEMDDFLSNKNSSKTKTAKI